MIQGKDERAHAATVARALRWPFLAVSLLPYLVGTRLSAHPFDPMLFLLGLLLVAFHHLGANLLNDLADARSGADALDPRFFAYFGGSKVIQQGQLSESWFQKAALAFFGAAALCAISLALRLRAPLVLWGYAIVLLLSCAYSAPPFQLAYRRLGEIVVWLLFGPVVVLAGLYFRQGQIHADGWLIGAAFGSLAAAVLVANEVPDFPTDQAVGKHTLVELTTPAHAWGLYLVLQATAFLSFLAVAIRGRLHGWSIPLLAAPGVLVVLSVLSLHRDYAHKHRLIRTSKLAIASHVAYAAVILLGIRP